MSDFSPEELKRIELTCSCRDTDGLPKVPGAGEVHDGVQTMHNGVRVVAGGYYGAWMVEIIRRLRGHHEPQEELAVHAVLERLALTAGPAPVVMELGAFWAYYSVWALHRLAGARSYLVEPDPAYLEVGRRNMALNGFEATTYQAAVGADAPPAPFDCESDGLSRFVSTDGLGSLYRRFGLDRVDLLLVDVQGAETPLLAEGRALLERGAVRFLVLSTHHEVVSGDPRTHEGCREVVLGAGGHVIAEHTPGESVSGDGLLVASFDPADRDLTVVVSRASAGAALFDDPMFNPLLRAG